jgi:hypothetical protein
MDRTRCPSCNREEKRVASVSQKADDKGRIYQIPCYFCVSCLHEEPVPRDVIHVWAQDYWAELPKSVRPPTTSPKRRSRSPSGGFDYL